MLSIHIYSIGNLQLSVGKLQVLGPFPNFVAHDAADANSVAPLLTRLRKYDVGLRYAARPWSQLTRKTKKIFLISFANFSCSVLHVAASEIFSQNVLR